MRPPLAQPLTLDFDQVWLIKTERGRALLDVLSSGEISRLLTGYCELDSATQVPTARLGSGPADATKFLRGDRTWAAPASPVGLVPIGSIIAWQKDLAGTPDLPPQFVECNGQTISDGGSPFNGHAIPNLNGFNQFLRGNSASGGTGGAAAHVHLYAGTTEIEDGDTDVQSDSGAPATVAALGHIHSYAGTTDAGDSLPPYLDVVWIMRIK